MFEGTIRKIHYAWVVLAVAFIGVLAAQGVRFTFGAFMEPWEQDFSSNRGTVSLISFISFIVFAISQPIVGKLVDRLGVKKIFVYSTFIIGIAIIISFFATEVWQLFIIYGIIASLGFGGASGVTASVAITKWFSDKQGLALGLVEAGFGAGQMIIVPSSILLIESFGWKWAVVILGVFLILVICPLLAILLKSEPEEIGLKPYGAEWVNAELDQEGTESTTKRNSLLDKRFWYLFIPFFVCGFTTTGLMDTHLIAFSGLCGFGPVVTSAAVSTLAAFNILGTLLAGILADRIDSKKILIFLYFTRALTIAFLFIFSSSVSLMAIFVKYPVLLIVFSISFGLVDFATVPPTIKLLSHYFRGQSFGLLSGWLFMGHQLGSALGSYIPGLLYDLTFSYKESFLIAFALLIAAGIFVSLLPKTRKV